VGVAAPEVSPEARAELAAAEVPVFLDSGAFSEVEFGPEGPRTVAPISPEEWTRRLELAEGLAADLGDLLHFVAPDKVGFPGETLGRLSRYRREVRRVAAHGARVLVALQGTDKVDFWRKVKLLDLAPADQLVAALPMKKNATTPDQVVDFVRRARPRAVHLLGLGAANRKAGPLVDALRAVDPELEITLDSNLIRANVGRKPRVRKLTAAVDRFLHASVFVRKCRGMWWAFGPGRPLVEVLEEEVHPDQTSLPFLR